MVQEIFFEPNKYFEMCLSLFCVKSKIKPQELYCLWQQRLFTGIHKRTDWAMYQRPDYPVLRNFATRKEISFSREIVNSYTKALYNNVQMF